MPSRLRSLVLAFCLYPIGLVTLGCEVAEDRESPAPTEADRAEPPTEPHWIVYQSSRSGEGDLYATLPGSGNSVHVLDSPHPEGGVRYDPSRQRLVHQRFPVDEGRVWLYSGDQRLFEDPNGDQPPAWSPAGDWIAYIAVRSGSDSDEQQDLFVARPDGNGEMRLTDDDTVDRYPTWSPDGSRIAFARRDDSGWDLYSIDVRAGATPDRLTRMREYLGHPSWSPDGTRIAFDKLYGEQTEIALLTLSTGSVARITERDGNDMAPNWAPDGRSLVFAGEPAGSGNWDVWSVDLGSLEVTRVTFTEGYDGAPVYVPASTIGR